MEGYCAPLKVSLKCLSHSNIWTVTRGEKCIRCNLGKKKMLDGGGHVDFQRNLDACVCLKYAHARAHTHTYADRFM